MRRRSAKNEHMLWSPQGAFYTTKYAKNARRAVTAKVRSNDQHPLHHSERNCMWHDAVHWAVVLFAAAAHL